MNIVTYRYCCWYQVFSSVVKRSLFKHSDQVSFIMSATEWNGDLDRHLAQTTGLDIVVKQCDNKTV